jgi:hypothetical protein
MATDSRPGGHLGAAGTLRPKERELVRRHPYHTGRILAGLYGHIACQRVPRWPGRHAV